MKQLRKFRIWQIIIAVFLKETIDPLTVTVEALKDQKGQLNEQDDQLKQLLLSLQKTAQSFHDESKAMMVMMASKQGGASSEKSLTNI